MQHRAACEFTTHKQTAATLLTVLRPWTRLGGALVIALLATLVGSDVGAGTVVDRVQLLAQYEPVLFFHPAEDWAPQPVDSYLNLAKVEQQVKAGTWSPAPAPMPTSNLGCLLSPCFRLNLPCALRSGYTCYHEQAVRDTSWSRPVVYATAVSVPDSTAPPPGQNKQPALLLHYWVFYAFDDWHSLHNRLWQTHEGDWESITVGLDESQKPLFAAYSEHCSGTVSPWRNVTVRGGTHPVAYVALGSHANWFSPAAVDTRFAECLKSGLAGVAKTRMSTLIRLAEEKIVDRMGGAHPTGPADLPGVTPLTLIPLTPSTTNWARFPGRWGEGQIVWLGSKPRSITTVSRGLAPGTPNWFAQTVGATWHRLSG
jgi:hypothetical protein